MCRREGDVPGLRSTGHSPIERGSRATSRSGQGQQQHPYRARVAIRKALKMVGSLESMGDKLMVICTDYQAAIVLLASGVGAMLRR